MYTPALFVVDDALDVPEFARAVAASKAAEYRDHVYQGHTYSGIAPADPVDLVPFLSGFFHQRARVRLSYFRLGLTMANESTPPRIHADTEIPCAWASVLYLNDQAQSFGGTAFWRHKWLGMDRIPKDTDQDVVDVVNADGGTPDKWELGTVVAMRPNRIIIYPTEYFHSRWPLGAYGEDVESGRRVHVSFFDLE